MNLYYVISESNTYHVLSILQSFSQLRGAQQHHDLSYITSQLNLSKIWKWTTKVAVKKEEAKTFYIIVEPWIIMHTVFRRKSTWVAICRLSSNTFNKMLISHLHKNEGKHCSLPAPSAESPFPAILLYVGRACMLASSLLDVHLHWAYVIFQ